MICFALECLVDWLTEFLQVETSSVCLVMVNYTAYANNRDKWLVIFYISLVNKFNDQIQTNN